MLIKAYCQEKFVGCVSADLKNTMFSHSVESWTLTTPGCWGLATARGGHERPWAHAAHGWYFWPPRFDGSGDRGYYCFLDDPRGWLRKMIVFKGSGSNCNVPCEPALEAGSQGITKKGIF